MISIVPYNDCLYRNMYQYEYITLLDTDEVIVPANLTNWSDLMEEVVKEAGGKVSWVFRNVYFFDEMLEREEGGYIKDIPPHLHMMQHVYRSDKQTPPGHYVKAFHDPSRVLTLHNHFPFSCLAGCAFHSVSPATAQLHHYREDCVADLRSVCQEQYKNVSVRDTSIWAVRETVVREAETALTTIGVSLS